MFSIGCSPRDTKWFGASIFGDDHSARAKENKTAQACASRI